EKPRSLPNPYGTKGLPNPYALATVAESAPVRFTDEQKAEQQKKTTAFHNPHKIHRPQPKGSGAQKRLVMSKPVAPTSSAEVASTRETTKVSTQHSLDYYRSTVEDDAATLDYKRQLQNEQREKKKQEKKFAKMYGAWKGDAPYRPDKWTNLRAYEMSGAYEQKKDSFAQFLATHSRPRQDSSDSSKPEHLSASSSDDLSGDTPPPEPQSRPFAAPFAAVPPPPASATYNPTISAPPVRYSHTISAPPVRYDTNKQVNDVVRNERPAKRLKMNKGAAMMAKMGYVEGQGLGKDSDGITTHLEVKARNKKNPKVTDFDDDDNDNGKSIKAQQVFDITGGHTNRSKEPGRFGEESKVVVAWGCVDGIDWAANADRGDGGIRQEMGQVFDEKFGTIERIHVNESSDQQTVYIKFVSELSALNAVNRFHEGYTFRGHSIRALYYPEEKFDTSIYDH
ncbi:hypothetical protein P280DRAFT_380536, partial [Massarina eburnea CBS 473.64]